MKGWAVCVVVLLAGCTRQYARNPEASPGAPDGLPLTSGERRLVFRGMCDASGAVPLAGDRFAVGDDEDNVLRIYDAARGGDPLFTIDVSPALELPVAKKKSPELDIEAATRLDDRALWLTSHGLSSSGKEQPSRLRFFATTAPAVGEALAPVGHAYPFLLRDMLEAPQLAAFGLAEAAKLSPKLPGGLNIEGMTRRLDGTSVLIGFRNPLPQGRALIVPLLNPLQLTERAPAQFGEPVLLDLHGLGVRSLSLWHGKYLIAAGPTSTEQASFRLFTWDGQGQPNPVDALHLEDWNPEAFVSREDRDEILLLSDDGNVVLDGKPCKKLKDPTKKQFRGLRVRLPS